MVRGQKSNDDVPRPAPLTAEPRAHVTQRERIAKPCAELHQRQSRGVLALSAIGSVIVRVIDMGEGCSLEAGVFHAPTLVATACEHPRDNSYSARQGSGLYKKGTRCAPRQ